MRGPGPPVPIDAAIAGAYRVSVELVKTTVATGQQETVRVARWFDADGRHVGRDRVAELEAGLAAAQGADYVPMPADAGEG